MSKLERKSEEKEVQEKRNALDVFKLYFEEVELKLKEEK